MKSGSEVCLRGTTCWDPRFKDKSDTDLVTLSTRNLNVLCPRPQFRTPDWQGCPVCFKMKKRGVFILKWRVSTSFLLLSRWSRTQTQVTVSRSFSMRRLYSLDLFFSVNKSVQCEINKDNDLGHSLVRVSTNTLLKMLTNRFHNILILRSFVSRRITNTHTSPPQEESTFIQSTKISFFFYSGIGIGPSYSYKYVVNSIKTVSLYVLHMWRLDFGLVLFV